MEERRSDGWCDGGDSLTDDERRWRNEAGILFQRLGDAYQKERFVISREEDEGGRVMVRDDERVRPGRWTEIRLWRYAGWAECVWERESYIRYVRWLLAMGKKNNVGIGLLW